MTDRERLIELIQNAVGGCAKHWAEIIADHLLANGVIVPPCKVGDTVYVVDGTTDDVVIGVITHFEYNIFTTPREWITVRGTYPLFGELDFKDRIDLLIGKTVFLTKEEAEKALKERGQNDR